MVVVVSGAGKVTGSFVALRTSIISTGEASTAVLADEEVLAFAADDEPSRAFSAEAGSSSMTMTFSLSFSSAFFALRDFPAEASLTGSVGERTSATGLVFLLPLLARLVDSVLVEPCDADSFLEAALLNNLVRSP